MRIAVDSKRQGFEATGKAKPVMAWVDTPEGRRKSKTEQERDEDTGMLLWEVQVAYDAMVFGEEEEVHAWVRVGAVDKPNPARHSAITFKFLDVEVRLNRNTNTLSESWVASEVEKMTEAKPAVGAPKTSDDAKAQAA